MSVTVLGYVEEVWINMCGREQNQQAQRRPQDTHTIRALCLLSPWSTDKNVGAVSSVLRDLIVASLANAVLNPFQSMIGFVHNENRHGGVFEKCVCVCVCLWYYIRRRGQRVCVSGITLEDVRVCVCTCRHTRVCSC